MSCQHKIAEKKAAVIAELEVVVKEHNEALELKNIKFNKYKELQASLKTLVELEVEAESEETTETEVVTE